MLNQHPQYEIIKILDVLLRACSRHESREWDEKPDQIHTSRLSSFFMDKTQKADCQSQPTINLDITTIATDHCLPVLYEHSGRYLTLQFLPECISTSDGFTWWMHLLLGKGEVIIKRNAVFKWRKMGLKIY